MDTTKPTPQHPHPNRTSAATDPPYDIGRRPGPLFPAVCDRSPHPLLFSPPFTDSSFPAPGAFPPEPEQHKQHQKRGRGLGSVEAPRACGWLQLASPWSLGRWVSRQLDDNFQLRVETTCLGGGTGPELGAIRGGGGDMGNLGIGDVLGVWLVKGRCYQQTGKTSRRR